VNKAQALKTIRRNIENLRAKISATARHWAARYNAPVYLVGSTLHNPTPRDCDIRIVVPDHEFAARYGHALVQKANPFRDRPEIVSAQVVDFMADGPTQRWIDDIAKFSGALSQQLQTNLDLQIWPESLWRKPYPEPLLLASPSPRWFFHEPKRKR
jgi:hypothetical protein